MKTIPLYQFIQQKICTWFCAVALSIFFLFPTENLIGQCVPDAGNDTTICQGQSIVLGGSPTAINALAGVTYSWISTASMDDNTIANPTSTPVSTASYTVTLTGGGCDGLSDIINVVVAPQPNANFTFTPNNSCATTPIQFTNTTSSCPACQYTWDFDDGSATTGSTNPNHTFTSAIGSGSQAFSVSLSVESVNGCVDNATNVVTVKQLPENVLTDPFSNFTNCTGTTNFDITVDDEGTTPGNTNYKIVWDDGNPDYNDANAPLGTPHTYSVPNIFSLDYLITGSNGCISNKIYSVWNTNPSIGVANPGGTQNCAPFEICFPVNNYDFNIAATTYLVEFGDGSPPEIFNHPPPTEICHTYVNPSCGAIPAGYTFSISAVTPCNTSAATIFPIKVFNAPDAAFIPQQTNACINESVDFTNTSLPGYGAGCIENGTYEWDFGDGFSVTSSATTLSHTYALAGPYTVTLTATNFCGTTNVSHDICIEEPPAPAFTVDLAAGCAPLNISISNLSSSPSSCQTLTSWVVDYVDLPCQPDDGNYTFINSTNASSMEPELALSSAGIYTVRLQMTNSCGLFEASEPIEVKGVPSVDVFAIPNACVSEGVTPSATVDGCNSPIIDYSWSLPGGAPASASGLISPAISYFASGNYSITLSATNVCGTGSDVESFFVLPAPDVQITSSDPDLTICEGKANTLTATGAASYTWSPNTFLSNDVGNIVISNPTSPITYTVTGTSGACQDVGSITFDIDPNPVLDVLNSNYSFCAGDSEMLGVIASGGSGIYTDYLWLPNTNLDDNSIPTPISFANVSTNYTAFVTDDHGCVGNVVVPVNVDPLPVVYAGDDIVACDVPFAFPLTGYSPTTNGTGPNGAGIWLGNNVTSEGIFTPAGIGITTLEYCFTDATTNCSACDQMTITVNSPSVVNAGEDIVACLSDPVIPFNPAPPGGIWSGVGVTSNGIFNPAIAGIGQAEILYTFGTGSCESVDTIYVTVQPLPIADFTITGIECTDSIVVNTNLSTGATFYSWDFDDGFLSSDFEPTHSFSLEGIYDVTLVVQNNFGCTDTSILPIEIITAPLADLIIVNSSGCGPLDVVFDNFSTGEYLSYDWDLNIATSTDIIPPITTYLQGTDLAAYPISLSVSNICGTSIDNDLVTVFPLPVAQFTTDIADDCAPVEVILNNLSTGLPDLYEWNFGDGSLSNLEDPPAQTYNGEEEITNYTISLYAENECGSDVSTFELTVIPNDATILFNEDLTEICLLSNIGISLELIEIPNVTWTLALFAPGANVNVDAPLEVHSNANEYIDLPGGNYQMVITMTNGDCTNSTSALPIALSYCGNANAFIPKCFTPNGDGINDLFTPMVWGIDPESYELTITNRDGNIVFYSTTIGEGWNGTTPQQSLDAQEGIYFYDLLYTPLDANATCTAVKDGKCEKLGHITIVR